jgi:hypothetical protein
MKSYPLLCMIGLLLHDLCLGQVQVSKEPRHHNVLENNHVRILDVHIAPGDTSLMHIHSTPSVFVILSNVKTGSQVIIEEDPAKYTTTRDGNLYFEGFYKQARIHRVWNSDTTEFHVMDIELPNNKYKLIDSVIRKKEFTVLFDEKPVRAYHFSLESGSESLLPSRKADILMIMLNDLSDITHANLFLNSRKVPAKSFQRKGDYFYVNSGNSMKIKNEGSVKIVFAFLELK